jgi:hypothetical protein
MTFRHSTGDSSPHNIKLPLASESTQLKGYGKRTLLDSILQVLFGSLSKSIRILFTVYIIVSLVYTFAHFFTIFHPVKLVTSTNSDDPSSATGHTILGQIVLDKSGAKSSSAVWTGRFSLISDQSAGTMAIACKYINTNLIIRYNYKSPGYFQLVGNNTRRLVVFKVISIFITAEQSYSIFFQNGSSS